MDIYVGEERFLALDPTPDGDSSDAFFVYQYANDESATDANGIDEENWFTWKYNGEAWLEVRPLNQHQHLLQNLLQPTPEPTPEPNTAPNWYSQATSDWIYENATGRIRSITGCDGDTNDESNLDIYLADEGDSTYFELLNEAQGDDGYFNCSISDAEIHADLYPKAAFDYENPQDSDGNNTYNIKLFLTDGKDTVEWRLDIDIYNESD